MRKGEINWRSISHRCHLKLSSISIMADAIVSDWLAEYNSLEPQEIRTFAALHAENHELSTAIHAILNDKTKHSDVSLLNDLAMIRNFQRFPCNFSFSIRSAFNSIISIVLTRVNWNASLCNSFRILFTCTWTRLPPARSRTSDALKRSSCVHTISRCATRKACWNPYRIECQFLLKRQFTTRKRIFTPVTLSDGKRTAIRRSRGCRCTKFIKSRLKIACRWWLRWCLSLTSNWVSSRNRRSTICARSVPSWWRRASQNRDIRIAHHMAMTRLVNLHLPIRVRRASSNLHAFRYHNNSSLSCCTLFTLQCSMSSHLPQYKLSKTFIIERVTNFSQMWY